MAVVDGEHRSSVSWDLLGALRKVMLEKELQRWFICFNVMFQEWSLMFLLMFVWFVFLCFIFFSLIVPRSNCRGVLVYGLGCVKAH